MTCPGGLGAQTWPELDERGCTLVVPLGSVEQHGPHLPLDTDVRIAAAVAEGATARVAGDVLVAPALNYGASGEHQSFPGTLSIGHEALRILLVEFGRSACLWARRVVFVNGHGGNVATLASAVALLRHEGRDVTWFPCALAGADAHAGDTETSLLLHLSPHLVRVARVASGNTAPVGELMGAMQSGGVRAVSATGVLGDPAGATADRGRALFDDLTARLVSAVDRWSPDANGMIR
ncbi:mycofactocin biosynthesis peptidyl-dipeptidase MftE [Williamsia sp.]|uniref:mycofactocin biosynthesis peptidyl-dipeptidase MftE n=1 Tax=Williamsia sp. TaxID=1872085 RepID=UPI001A2BAB7E|nr:mycofactocin biosynthesis peptidyl-dipeptidase MftE [Williamsia sp.]MBJ7287704.1 mycofactocin biosynthesis peptidyl-dipeptidase MftE [Williamsia sp.]